MKNKSIWIILLVLGIIGIDAGNAQDKSNNLAQQVIQENQKVVDAIALYPAGIRKEVFEASLYPEVIVKLTSMQKKTQQEFDDLLSPFQQEEQEKIWNMTRYSGLISDLCSSSKTSKDQITSILTRYPEEIQATGIEEGLKRKELLCTIDHNSRKYNAALDAMLISYPPEVDSIFRDLINYPEILTILSDNMQFTVILGDAYKKNPKAMLYKTDSLNTALAQKNAKEVADWKNSLDENPKAKQEYVEAAKQYAEDNGYQSEDYSTALNPNVADYYTYSYNWWFGYPYWYPYAYWDPYPYWYDWGFYYGPGNAIVVFGLPSNYFMHWFFYYPQHYFDYPQLANHYYNYYLDHSFSRNNNAISREVDEWRENNREIVNSNWNNKNTDRTQLFKEYGKMENQRNKYNKQNEGQEMQRGEFLQKNQNKYHGLYTSYSTEPIKMETFSRYSNPIDEVPAKVPVVKAPDSFRVVHQSNQPAKQDDAIHPFVNNPHPVIPATRQETPNSNQFRNAQQYHQNTWQQVRPHQNYSSPHMNQNYSIPHGGSGGKRK
jgi:hypothetical protein